MGNLICLLGAVPHVVSSLRVEDFTYDLPPALPSAPDVNFVARTLFNLPNLILGA